MKLNTVGLQTNSAFINLEGVQRLPTAIDELVFASVLSYIL